MYAGKVSNQELNYDVIDKLNDINNIRNEY